MQQLISGIVSYITSFRPELAIASIMIGGIMWLTGHRFYAIIEILAANAIIFTASTIAGQAGFG